MKNIALGQEEVYFWAGDEYATSRLVLTPVERICYTQPMGTKPHASTSPLERRSGGILLS
jgi:hypothetical protein